MLVHELKLRPSKNALYIRAGALVTQRGLFSKLQEGVTSRWAP